jgi:hypothetical protein
VPVWIIESLEEIRVTKISFHSLFASHNAQTEAYLLGWKGLAECFRRISEIIETVSLLITAFGDPTR